MKWLLRFMVCAFMLLSPITAYAEGETFEFQLNGDDWVHEELIIPDETIEDQVSVTNMGKYPMEYRLESVENLGDSELFDVMTFSLFGSEYVKLSQLQSDWIKVESGETHEGILMGYLPANVGNEWQGKTLNARFHFTARMDVDEDEHVEIEQNGSNVIIKTGDNTDVSSIIWIMMIALIIMAVCIKSLIRRR